MTDLILHQAVAAGEVLGTHRGVDYVRVCAVFALPHDPALSPQFYALDRDWPGTPIGEITARDREIADLQRQVEQLQAQLATGRVVPPQIAAAATGMPALVAAAPAPPAPPPARERPRIALKPLMPCPYCERTDFRTAHGLNIHIGKAHRELQHAGKVGKHVAAMLSNAPLPPPPENIAALKVALGVNEDWLCADCDSDARAQSIRDPSRCVQCAKHHPIAPAQIAA